MSDQYSCTYVTFNYVLNEVVLPLIGLSILATLVVAMWVGIYLAIKHRNR